MQRITDKVFEGGRRGEEGGGGGVGIYGLALINSPCVDGAVLQKAFFTFNIHICYVYLTYNCPAPSSLVASFHIWVVLL